MLPYCIEDSEESKKLALELFVLLRFDVSAVQLDLLARSIAAALNSLVIGSFLQLLYVEKVLTANFHQFSQLFYQLVSRARSQAGVDILFVGDSGVVATIELERGVTGAGILGVVIGKLRYWQ